MLYLQTDDAKYRQRACELGDVGSCLLDTLALLDEPATKAKGIEKLGDECHQGSASACAWRLEFLRGGHDHPDYKDAFLYGQRACIELYEPVACAAAAKAMHGHDMKESASTLAAYACRLGYEPMCKPDFGKPLAEEQPPQLVGPTMLDQTSGGRTYEIHEKDAPINHPDFWPKPLEGRPNPPGMERVVPKPYVPPKPLTEEQKQQLPERFRDPD